MVLGEEHVTAPLYATRFLTIETRGLNILGECLEVGCSIVRSGMVFLERGCATVLTRSSVHWAERIVAMRSSKGEEKSRAHCASG
jgi:hypothetical protein